MISALEKGQSNSDGNTSRALVNNYAAGIGGVINNNKINTHNPSLTHNNSLSNKVEGAQQAGGHAKSAKSLAVRRGKESENPKPKKKSTLKKVPPHFLNNFFLFHGLKSIKNLKKDNITRA
jgi:hypothetical protein